MVENRAYIKINKSKYVDEIIEVLREILKDNSEIVINDKIGTITSYDDDCFLQKLKNFATIHSLDAGVNISILVVPCFQKRFVKYLDFINNEACSLFDVFIKNINDIKVIEDSKKIVQNISKKNLDTIEAFIDCNMNSLQASNQLYLHRNSFNYRLGLFVIESDMDIRDINTIMFIKLILNIAKNM